MRRLLTLLLCLLPVLASAQTGTVISGDQVMVGGRRLSDALDLKADKAPLAAALLAKADRSTTSATLANTVTLPTFTSALAGKVDTGTYTAGLSTKADQAAVNAALATKADAATTATALGLKANASDLTSGLASKANNADVTNALALKVNLSSYQTDMAGKANVADVATQIASATAPLATTASPTFTGTVKAPTVAAGDSSAKVATTSFVSTAVTAALATLSPVAPTFGTSVGGETTLAAPAAVPTAAPFWVRVTFGGVVQRPGADFTSNGTSTITLAVPLDAGVPWMVEQLQRNPS